MKHRLLHSLLILFAVTLLPLTSYGQLSSETYKVVGQFVGGTRVSIDSSSESYQVTQESGGLYTSGEAQSQESAVGFRRPVQTTQLAAQQETPQIPLSVGQRVPLCHFSDGVYQRIEQDVYVFVILHQQEQGIKGHDGDQMDVIPPFYYDIGEGLFLYSGKNWTFENQQIFVDGCARVSVQKDAFADADGLTESTKDTKDSAEGQEEIIKVYVDEDVLLTYLPFESLQETVSLYASVGPNALLRLRIAPDTFVLPDGVDKDIYEIHIHIQQTDKEQMRQIISAVTQDAPKLFPPEGGSATARANMQIQNVPPMLTVTITDSEGRTLTETDLQNPIDASLYIPDMQSRQGEIYGMYASSQAVGWRRVLVEHDEDFLNFSIDDPGIFSFWNYIDLSEATGGERPSSATATNNAEVSLQCILLFLLAVILGVITVVHVVYVLLTQPPAEVGKSRLLWVLLSILFGIVGYLSFTCNLLIIVHTFL